MQEATAPAAKPARLSARRLVRWLVLLLVLVIAGFFAYRYWRHSQLFLSTDDAYVGANTVQVSAQVSGPVTRVYVQNNQHVKAGEPLFDIDPTPFQLAVNKAQAQLALAEQGVAQQQAAIAAARAQVAQRQAELQNAEDNYHRTEALVAQNFMSRAAGVTARTQVATAQASVAAAQAQVQQAVSALGASGAQNAQVQAARNALNQAKLDLAHTHVTASTAGVVANLSLRPGNVVQPGAPLFALIASNEYWVDANYKETELNRIHPGQKATIEVDMYPNHPFAGEVESVSGGAGTAFSLLPPQNATGNWVKVTQRVPVRVRINQPDPRYPLRIGTTATVTINVKG